MAHLFNINELNKLATLQNNNQAIPNQGVPTASRPTTMEKAIVFYIVAGFLLSVFIYVILMAYYPKLLLICCRKCRSSENVRRSAENLPLGNELIPLEPKPSTSGTRQVSVIKADLNAAAPCDDDVDSDDEQPPSLETITERKNFCPVDYIDVSEAEQEELIMKNIKRIPSEEEISTKKPAEN